jgi:hypothetical protein
MSASEHELRRLVDAATTQCAPRALQRAVPLFAEVYRQPILDAAAECERAPSRANLEKARKLIHDATHASKDNPGAYAAGHNACYAVATADTALAVYQAYLDLLA